MNRWLQFNAIGIHYFWHLRWTWRDREGAFFRFQMVNGLVSLISNVLLMRVLAGHLNLPPVPANLIAIALTSLVNFFLGDRWVFKRDAALVRQTPFR